MILHVDVANKIATYQKRDGFIVCGNRGYEIKFSFDNEWSGYAEKTARFIWNGRHFDVDFTGDTCDVPIIYDTTEVEVGVYVGELKTTTSALIECRRSVLCKNTTPSEENDRAHANEAKKAADRAEAAAKVAEEAANRAENAGGGGGGGVKFTTDKTLTLSAAGVLSVNLATETDRSLPITAADVDVTVGNINVLLGII